jgi:pteridine reductase
MLNLSGKHILVTGGAVRIGAAICTSLARAGASVGIHYHHSVDEATALAARLRADFGVEVSLIRGSLADPSEAGALMGAAWDAMGGVDGLVNNAAVFHKESLAEMTLASFEAELAVNALSPIMLVQAFARCYTGVPGAGCVVNLLDRRVATPAAGELPYQLSKRMLGSFTELAAVELAPAIRVNAVAPGPVLPPPGLGEAYLREKAGDHLTASRCSTEDIADAVLYLLRATSVTGETLFVDSGQRLLG